MSKGPAQYKILIAGDNSVYNTEVAHLLQGNNITENITADFKFRNDEFYKKFDIIILVANNPNIAFNSLLFSIKILMEVPVIVISDFYSAEDISTSKVRIRKNSVFDFLPYSHLSHLLLIKTVKYVFEINKEYLKNKTLQKKYDDLFHMNPLPMWIYDVESLSFLEINKAAELKYGYSRKEFLNMTLRDIRPNEDIAKLEKAINIVKKHEKLFSNGIFRHKKKDGGIIYVELVGNIIYIQKIKCEIVLANDITDSINYIQAIENQNSKLQEIAFAHSHIIRAPLTNMIGILNLIKDTDSNSLENSELLDHLFTSCNQLDERITEIVKKSTSYSSENNF